MMQTAKMSEFYTNTAFEKKRFDAVQLSAESPTNGYMLSVLVKKTYTLSQLSRCGPSEQQIPLIPDMEEMPENPMVLANDMDFYPFKPLTDVIIKGHVYGNGILPKVTAAVQVGAHHHLALQVSGHRRAYKDNFSRIQFTDPLPIEKIPLTFDNAYGGIDHFAEETLEIPPKEILAAMPEMDWKAVYSPYRYPRNYGGKGYVVLDNPRAFENLELPNLEDPEMPLTPDNLLLGDFVNWLYQPPPLAFSWVGPDWFPRLAYTGLYPLPFTELERKPFPEMRRNQIDPIILKELEPHKRFSMRLANGATPALQFPYLKGTEWIRLFNIHPRHAEFSFQLPGEVPKIWVDGRKGTLKPTEPVIHTVIIEPDEQRVSIVWRGCAPALRPYMDEDLAQMPFMVSF